MEKMKDRNGILIFGGLMIDRYFMVNRFPQRGGDALILDTYEYVGGCSINMAMTIKNLGGTPYIISHLANDAEGTTCLDYVRAKGLPEDCIKMTDLNRAGDSKAETGYSMVFVEPDGERTFLTKEGVEGWFEDALVSGDIKSGCGTAAVTGYYLLNDEGRKVIRTLETLKRDEVLIVFDPGPMVSHIDPGVLRQMIEISDAIIPNMEEAIFLAGEGDPEIWASELASQGKIIVLTRGAKGGTVFSKNEHFRYDIADSATVDSTGAGDSFTGALACGLSQNRDLESSVELAKRCAALTAGVYGPHGEFSREDIYGGDQ